MERDVHGSIKYFIVAIVSFLAIIAANISLVFKPLYKTVYYGQANPIFYAGLSSLLLIIFFFLIKFLLIKKLGVTYERDKNPLPMKNLLLVYFITIVMIFIISAIIGFDLKIIYDMGEKFTGFEMVIHIVEILYYSVMMVFVMMMIENFQMAFDKVIPIKNEKFHKYIPYGGIATMLTYGFYALIVGINSYPVLYFFLIILYGFIYLICHKSIKKSYISSLFIYLF